MLLSTSPSRAKQKVDTCHKGDIPCLWHGCKHLNVTLPYELDWLSFLVHQILPQGLKHLEAATYPAVLVGAWVTAELRQDSWMQPKSLNQNWVL